MDLSFIRDKIDIFPAIISLTITIVLLCFSAIISASEIAFFSLDPQTMNELEES